LLSSLSGTITPWVLGTLLILLFLALAIVIKSWREMKRSPYFFMRRQAEQRLQTYSFTSLGLLVTTLIVAGFTLQAPTDQTPLVAVLTDAKPASDDVMALVASSPTVAEAIPETAVEPQIISTAIEDRLSIANVDELVQATLTLPDEYNKFEPTTELSEDTALGAIAFSTKINDEYEAIAPTDIFAVGSYTLYATFSYEGMADGMAWAWVWKRDGEVIDGGNELWKYGSEGPGYIYFNPEEGFRAGEYSLEVWVNEELMTRSQLTMTGSALSSGN